MTDLLVWGIVVHLVCDWLLQNDWMAQNKAKRRKRWPSDTQTKWWDRHPAAYVHAGIHTIGMLLVFSPLAALIIGITHLVIDTRKPVEWWSKLIRQKQPGQGVFVAEQGRYEPVYDLGTEVRIWSDQVWHILILALVSICTITW